MPHTVAQRNTRFALPGQLAFRADSSGLVFAEVDSGQAVATICLQGGHVVTWRPRDQAEPAIWVSEAAKYAPGKSIRGGVPVCWPWFGPHPTESTFPGHGFARTVHWDVADTGVTATGEIQLSLLLQDNEQTRLQWPHPCRLELRVLVGATLRLSLVTTNLGDSAFVIGEALHTYFRIGDIGDIKVVGLEHVDYVDKADGGRRKLQEGPVIFSGEVDRVYLNSMAECAIEDPTLGRRIRIAKEGSQSTVLWTPWREKAEKMGDFGPGRRGQDGWREMVCVESGNALDNTVRVPPGQSHALAVEYRVEKL